ncbi:hypothetical protein RHSIM_Rhsim12G0191000 [Rhododendron simsii]|uniref:Uncharacterized protein n=1 Tax=Rhododendron simsii TaxID=118357 RepID=A0A834G4P1_RHOSS|nr:hypothetical protein RHSIM_Rhsim12G0191000 [Rhododendron simsii]
MNPRKIQEGYIVVVKLRLSKVASTLGTGATPSICITIYKFQHLHMQCRWNILGGVGTTGARVRNIWGGVGTTGARVRKEGNKYELHNDCKLDIFWNSSCNGHGSYNEVLSLLDGIFVLCVWSSDERENQARRVLEIPAGASWRTPTPAAPTHVQVHQDQFHLLVVHETQIAIYDPPKLEYNKQVHGTVTVLMPATLTTKCRISPTAYLPSNPSPRVYPLVITAHPLKPNQFAFGLTDGGVYVLEPMDAGGTWGTTQNT